MNTDSRLRLRLLSVLVASGLMPDLFAQPPAPAARGPGYSGAYPNAEDRARLKELEGLETARPDALFGPGPWRFDGLVPPIPYTPGPAEKDVHRLGALTVKGPHLAFESPFCKWQLPCETHRDVDFAVQFLTGEGDAPPREELSPRLAEALRRFRHFGPVARGLRAALVPSAARVAANESLAAELLLYNATGKPLQFVSERTLLRVVSATAAQPVVAAVALAPPLPSDRPIVLRPGQSLERSFSFAGVEWRDGEGAVVAPAKVAPPGKQVTLAVEIQLAPDARGHSAVVTSEPATVVRLAAGAAAEKPGKRPR